MSDLFTRIAAAADTDEDAARRSVGYIASFLKRESSDPAVEAMIARTPGVVEAMSGVEAAPPGFGIFGLGSQLMGLGLDRTQIRAVAEELVAYAKGTAGEETVGRAISSVPALAPFV